MAKLSAELSRTTENRDILKGPPRTLQNSQIEVRVHLSQPIRIQTLQHVPSLEDSPHRFLFLAKGVVITPCQSQRGLNSQD